MGRPDRIFMPGYYYHVYDRGNEKMDIFADDNERKAFLGILRKTKKDLPFRIHAYVLMSNHYHLLVEQGEIPLSRIMQVIKSKYSHYYNLKHNRVGHLFQGRYKCIIVGDNEYLAALIGYINMNPVKGKLAKDIADYPWSSHAEIVGVSKAGLADRGAIRTVFGDEKNSGISEYMRFMVSPAAKKSLTPQEYLFDKMVSGTKEFTENVLLNAKKSLRKIPKPAFRGDWAEPGEILLQTAKAFDVDMEEMMAKKGKWNTAKKAAIYLLWHYTKLSAAQIAGIFNRQHPSGIKRIISSIEEESSINQDLNALLEKAKSNISKK